MGQARFLLAGVIAGVLTALIFAAQDAVTPPQSPMTMHDSKAARAPAPADKVLSRSAHDITPLDDAAVERLADARGLTEEERRVILSKGTEPAFCGNLTDNKMQGVYLCRLCELPLFSSDAKFDSGTGWPSFFAPVDRDHIRYQPDNSHGFASIEILCARCGGHLGHVFEDGPRPTGLRYCLNSVSMEFVEKGKGLPGAAAPVETKTAYFAGGCFWSVEHALQETPGVVNVVSGFMGGKKPNPTYKGVCYEDTGHAETVMVTYDPARVAYRDLLKTFFWIHDPTQKNRQGPDVGSQYRSAVYTVDEEQAREVKAYIAEIGKEARFKGRAIVTEVRPVSEAGKFYPAEAHHQDYHERNGGVCNLPEWAR